MAKNILLSYDVEEFDMCFEYKGSLTLQQQVDFSTQGLDILLAILNKYQIKATFYTTAVYALAKPELIKSLAMQGHEIASHTYYHSQFQNDDLLESKKVLEQITGKEILGLRMPRLIHVDAVAVKTAGYRYNSSINPTYLPGRYNHFFANRVVHQKDGVVALPASVTPLFRIPLFWLAFHNFPFALYWLWCKITLTKDEYLNLYFHPWEFKDYKGLGNAIFPNYVTRHCGAEMAIKTEKLIKKSLAKGYVFCTTAQFLRSKGYL